MSTPEIDAPPPRPASRWLRPIVAALLACTLATLGGAAGRWHWLLELLCHFTLQLAAVTALLLLALLILRRWRWSLLAAAVLAVLVSRDLRVPRARPPAGFHPAKVRLLLANVLTLGEGDYQPLRDYIQASDVDVLMIVELSPKSQAQLRPLLDAFPHQQSIVREDSFGMGIFSRYPLTRKRVENLDGQVPTLASELVLDGDLHVELMLTHPIPPMNRGQAARRNLQLRQLAAQAAAVPARLVVAGDLNCTPWSPYFRQLLRDGKLRDTRIGLDHQPSWNASHPWPLRIPIDHVLVSGDVRVRHREVGPAYGSDHLPVLVELAY